jgi:hypothetical protein
LELLAASSGSADVGQDADINVRADAAAKHSDNPKAFPRRQLVAEIVITECVIKNYMF